MAAGRLELRLASPKKAVEEERVVPAVRPTPKRPTTRKLQSPSKAAIVPVMTGSVLEPPNMFKEEEDNTKSFFLKYFCTSGPSCAMPTPSCSLPQQQFEEEYENAYDNRRPVIHLDEALQPAGPALATWLERSAKTTGDLPLSPAAVDVHSTSPRDSEGFFEDGSITYGEVMDQSPRKAARTSLGMWLAQRGLAHYERPLAELGVKRLSDLAYLTEEDLRHINMDPSHRNFFLVQITP